MDKINEYTKLMGEWLESPIDKDLIKSVEETYLILKASKSIASSIFDSETEAVKVDLTLDTYALIVDTKLRNSINYDADIYIEKDILDNVVDNDVETEEEDV